MNWRHRRPQDREPAPIAGGRSEMKPTFLIIGAGKAGTTTLYDLIGQHPSAAMAQCKEPMFFSHDENFARGIEWYESLFDCPADTKAIGEASIQYSMTGIYPQVAHRIGQHLPDAKIIYIVRHPLDRIESMWTQWQHAGFSQSGHVPTLDFGADIKNFPDFIDSSLYWKQLSAYRQYFPDEQILVLFYEDLCTDAAKLIEGTYDFLGLEPCDQLEDVSKPRNATADHQMDTPLMSKLRHMSLYQAIKNAIPHSLRDRLRKSQMLRRDSDRPLWKREAREWAIEQIVDDTRQFLTHCGKPVDYWRLDPREKVEVA